MGTAYRGIFLFVLIGAVSHADRQRIDSKSLLKTTSLSGKGDTVLLVPQHTYESSAYREDETETLETCSIRTCIAVTVYDPISRKGALGHFDTLTDVGPSLTEIFQQFPAGRALQVTAMGGLKKWSESLMDTIEDEAKRQGFPVTASEGPYPFSTDAKCIRLGLRKGEVAVLADPQLAPMPYLVYDRLSPLARMRDAELYIDEKAPPHAPPPMAPPTPPSLTYLPGLQSPSVR